MKSAVDRFFKQWMATPSEESQFMAAVDEIQVAANKNGLSISGFVHAVRGGAKFADDGVMVESPHCDKTKFTLEVEDVLQGGWRGEGMDVAGPEAAVFWCVRQLVENREASDFREPRENAWKHAVRRHGGPYKLSRRKSCSGSSSGLA